MPAVLLKLPRTVLVVAFALSAYSLEDAWLVSIVGIGAGDKISHDGHTAYTLEFNADSSYQRLFDFAGAQTLGLEEYVGIRARLYNPNSYGLSIRLQANATFDGKAQSRSVQGVIPPESHYEITLFFDESARERCEKVFWGMRGLPIRHMDAEGNELKSGKLLNWQLDLPYADFATKLYLEDVNLIARDNFNPENMIGIPFIDPYGQFRHEDWPGKIRMVGDLKQSREQELGDLNKAPELKDRDAFGGWASGPQLEPTAWFRVQKVGGKWWLVTPTGRLFFSNGMDCVGLSERTFVEGRESWFEWLPTPELPPYGEFYGFAEHVHSMADTIGGKGKTYDFYQANLYRKYGENWKLEWRARTYSRLRSWGFNTLGNWCDWDVLKNSPIPFVAPGSISGVGEIEGSTGYWAKMKDVYSPEFAQKTEELVQSLLNEFGKNPLCIGYFIDNELAWEGVSQGILKSPADQPARQALIAFLQKRYGELALLNAAWGAEWENWEDVAEPTLSTGAFKQDQDDFLYEFALHYFQTIQASFRKYGSRQLYLGCRFSSAPEPVVKASTEVADVTSFNLYKTSLDSGEWEKRYPWDAPMLIGEFHFGALDRGMFHTGLVPAKSQKDRAERYANYVRSVADNPNFVGCHWFQYVDEASTGRFYDGENYNIGFVSIGDTPYPELADAARGVHQELYNRRAAGN